MDTKKYTPSQTELIFAHLIKHGYITPIIAMHEYGCMRLAARIHDIRGALAPGPTSRLPSESRLARLAKRAGIYTIISVERTSEAGQRYTKYEPFPRRSAPRRTTSVSA